MFGENLKAARKAAGLTQAELAKKCNTAQTTIAGYENGIRQPKPATIDKFARALRVSSEYLISGTVSEDLTSAPPPPSVPGARWVPVLGTIPAGTPVEAVRDVLDWEEISPHTAAQGAFFALRVKGDSMEPNIRSGDIVIVQRQDDCESGRVAVVMVNGEEATLKRVKKAGGGLLLLPDNARYEPAFFTAEQIAALPVAIIGTVIELRRSAL